MAELLDGTGKTVDNYSYDVCGAPFAGHPSDDGIAEAVPQPLPYGGYVYDWELVGPGWAVGWYWAWVRSYDPVVRRFLQPDPIEREVTRSHVYAGGAPVDYADPSGLAAIEELGDEPRP